MQEYLETGRRPKDWTKQTLSEVLKNHGLEASSAGQSREQVMLARTWVVLQAQPDLDDDGLARALGFRRPAAALFWRGRLSRLSTEELRDLEKSLSRVQS